MGRSYTATAPEYSESMTSKLRSLGRRRGILVALQLVVAALVIGFLAYFLRGAWAEAWPLMKRADPVEIGLALASLTLYYLLFVIGWQWILATLGIRIGYWIALQAEMASMLAKYVPGTVWTPLARIVWLRRVGVHETSLVVGSILLEAALSALSGVFVFAIGLLWVQESDAPLVPLAVFSVVIGVLIHPRIFGPLSRRVFTRFGGTEAPSLPYATMLGLVGFYAVTWVVGGTALFFLLRSVGGDPALSSIPYLGGTAAVGAIAAVLSFFAPSGLGVREGSMYGLMLAVATEGVALGATVLNRLDVTLVEAALLLGALAVWGARRRPPEPAPEPSSS
jgi:glycosyltransferase 2 family protein